MPGALPGMSTLGRERILKGLCQCVLPLDTLPPPLHGITAIFIGLPFLGLKATRFQSDSGGQLPRSL